MAGHSSWKNIKHRKAAVDAKRGKAWSRCARVIIVAARTGGGDPETNLSLRYAIDDAKFYNMPKDTIEKAIKKGTGELAGESIEAAMYEGYAHGVAFLIEILTDNRNRTAGDVRHIFEKNGGQLGKSGSVAYLFAPKGQLIVAKSTASEDAIMALALEAGAEDVVDAGEAWQVLTAPGDFIPVRLALENAKIRPESAELIQVPSNTVAITGHSAETVLKIVDALDDNDDVQKVHANFEIAEEELAKMK
jgi:YebC/PmpR family DNA-binding regulatory protein